MSYEAPPCTFPVNVDGVLCGQPCLPGQAFCGKHRATLDKAWAQVDMAALGVRRPTPPALPTDRVRLHVALWKIAKACGHDLSLDAQQPDHVLVEIVSELVTPALAKAFRDGYRSGYDEGQGFGDPGMKNPYDGSEL